MRVALLLLLAGCSWENSPAEPAAEAEIAMSFSADAYATCTACHLADGAGVPGAFPRVRSRAATMAMLDGGREYLIAVVSHGLMGSIEVDGMQYFGIMPGNSGTMDAETIAAALNYLVFELKDAEAGGLTAFTAEEVEAAQAATDANPQAAHSSRVELAQKHGEEWPR